MMLGTGQCMFLGACCICQCSADLRCFGIVVFMYTWVRD